MEDLYEKRQQQRKECDGKAVGRMRTEMQQVFAPIVDIAENHSESIELIAKDHFQKRDQLRMNGGCGNQYGGGDHGNVRCKGAGQGRGKGYGSNGKGGMHEKHKGMMNSEDAGRMFGVHFLLMDTEQKLNTTQITERKFEVMPNPSGNSNTINYEVLSAGKVKIDVLDKDGFIVRTVLDATKEKGVYSINVNTGDLEQNLYFYRIMDNSGTDSIKFIVAR